MSTIAKQVWPLVVKDMLERNEEGAKKYNRYLQTDCPDNLLQHAYEEALDLAVYLKTCIEQQKEKAIGPKTISGLDTNNCCVSGRRESNIQRNTIFSARSLF